MNSVQNKVGSWPRNRTSSCVFNTLHHNEWNKMLDFCRTLDNMMRFKRLIDVGIKL